MSTLTGRPDTESSDADDVALAAAGDTHAFERLYRRHVDRIHSLARRMIDGETADEATQDVFVRAWQKLDTFRGDSAFGTWLYRVAINVILGKRRKLGRRRDRFIDDATTALERLESGRTTPELAVDFEGAIGELPDGARRIFVLHDVEGYKHQEIAAMLEISVGTSKSQLHRARMMLRDHVDR